MRIEHHVRAVALHGGVERAALRLRQQHVVAVEVDPVRVAARVVVAPVGIHVRHDDEIEHVEQIAQIAVQQRA